MDHHNDNVLILPIFGGPMQISGYGDSFDGCRYPSAGCLHWLLGPTTEDAPVVQMAHLDQPCPYVLFLTLTLTIHPFCYPNLSRQAN